MTGTRGLGPTQRAVLGRLKDLGGRATILALQLYSGNGTYSADSIASALRRLEVRGLVASNHPSGTAGVWRLT